MSYPKLRAMASNQIRMACKLIAMVMASNQTAMASNLITMASISQLCCLMLCHKDITSTSANPVQTLNHELCAP